MRKAIAGALIGLTAAAVILGAEALFKASGGGTGSDPLTTIELKTYDWRMAHTARPATARPDIALVAIDEYSLRNLEKNAGRWPWPRAVHSEVIDYLAKAGAKVIAYDVDFADPDTRSGFPFGGSTWSGAESDQALVDSVKAAGNVVLLADATYEASSGTSRGLPDPGYRLDAPGILERKVVFPPFGALASAAAALGHNLFVLDPDGPLRHTVPFVRTGRLAIPSLGLAAALRADGIPPAQVRLHGRMLHIGPRVLPLQWRHVQAAGGTTSFLWGLIDFHGPALLADLKGHTYPTYSFFDLLYSEEQILAGVKPNVDPAAFRNKIVFVGVTATGLHDVFETPFAHGRMPGIQVHAAVADDVLSGRFMAPAPAGVRLATVLAAGLLVGLAATMVPAWWAAAATLAGLALFGWAATRLFAGGYWLDVTEPGLTGALALFGGVAYQYVVEGREKRKMKKLFGQYVSRDVYEQLVANPGLARLGGQRREMTVLFSDIRGFTTVSEHGRPEDIVHLLNEYFTRMVAIVLRHHGTVDKFVGDMVMALFGAPLDDPDHAAHAVEAALDMLDELARLNARWAADGRPPIDIGIGISTGPMIAGNIGSEQIMSYTVIGDAVNLGARLESLNKEYGTHVIVSEATRARLDGRYDFRPLGDVVVKGRTQAAAIFELAGRPSATPVSRPEAVASKGEARV
ncbi:MAG: adenylate/guanylate cyclase domain-containing protein [Acidobacteriota bacterium]|nr:adenylate/guanylate cyclase domain-containing protein [Acidobacteriota bacterium]